MSKPDQDPVEPQAETSPADTKLDRRKFLAGAATAIGAGALGSLVPLTAQQAPPAAAPPAPPTDGSRVPGAPSTEVGVRSPFEQPKRRATGAVSQTPLQDLHGTITPADLHFERHHSGVPQIDPASYTLLIHGLVDRPMVFTLEDLKRYPATTRICFIECSGNGGRPASEEMTPQQLMGLTSQTEWTGVMLSTLLREVGVQENGSWILCEGQDAGLLSRSLPMSKALDDAMIVYAQNGEALRPENGYPARLLTPGYEGNSSVKWLRRMEIGDQPFWTREETSRYSEALKDGTARMYSLVMDARSIITSPSFPKQIQRGWNEIRGIAWSGRGSIARAELSFDEGRTWHETTLQGPVLPKAHTRFTYMWNWNGGETTILSRAVDDTGYVQPMQQELIAARGLGSGPYHLNSVIGWRIRPDGSVVFRVEPWA